MAEIPVWRERRWNGWSETEYKGIFLPGGDHGILVSKLSHGYRVMAVHDPSDYLFDVEHSVSIEVSHGFVSESLRMLAADERYQSICAKEYDAVIAS